MLYSDGIPSYPARLPFLRMFNFRLILRASAYQKVGLSIYHELSGSHYSVIKCCKGSCEKNEKYAYFMKRGTTQICFTTNVLHLITFHLYFRYSDKRIYFHWLLREVSNLHPLKVSRISFVGSRLKQVIGFKNLPKSRPLCRIELIFQRLITKAEMSAIHQN